jgi:hypothetical protein
LPGALNKRNSVRFSPLGVEKKSKKNNKKKGKDENTTTTTMICDTHNGALKPAQKSRSKKIVEKQTKKTRDRSELEKN